MDHKALTYHGRLAPYPHQVKALQRMQNKQAFALFMFMRTGKTKVILDEFGQLEQDGKVKDMLVIAPAGVYRTWVTAVQDHVAEELQRRLAIFVWNSATAKGQKVTLSRQAFLAIKNQPRILLMNAEALSTVIAARQCCIDFLLANKQASMLVIDESTVIKNKSKRTKVINNHLSHLATYRRILSGLPAPRSPLDFYHQFEFLDHKILNCPSPFIFQMRYAINRKMRSPQGHYFWEVVGYQNLDQLQRLIEPYSFQVPFRPKIPSTFTIHEVQLTAEQKRIYAEMKKFATAKLEGAAHVTATVVIAQILRLHQILCGHTMDEQNQLHAIPEHRTAALLELLEDYSGKAVIWCSYDYNVRKVSEALAQEFGPQAVARFWGGNVATREAEELQFRTNPDCRFMVATQSAGGRGRTLVEADLVVYYSSTNNLEHRDQSEQRVQGIDKDRQVDYIDLIVPNTVEPKILNALRKKMDLASQLVGDEWREWVV
jgi:hypothetical protein